jgi:putative membrane protein
VAALGTSAVSTSRFDAQPSVSNHFAWLRTYMALQRTLLAGVRTAVSLIGFGFTVAQFFQHIRSNLPEDVRHLRSDVPRDLGLALILAGVISLSIFTLQYHNATAYLRKAPFDVIAGASEKPMHLSTYLVSFVVLIIGVAAFVCVFARF